MDITAVSHSLPAPVAAAPEVPPQQAADNRAIIQAVKAVNGTEMFGHDNLLTFQRDQRSQRMVIRVVNRKTNEVVSQIPAEYLLRLAEDAKQR
jgi:flagellar protein FlaG